jgi:hypothetical protein
MTTLEIRFGYAWSKKKLKDDPKYVFLKSLADKTAKAVEAMAARDGDNVVVNLSRLRARHGVEILSELRKRIYSADVLLFDLDGENANVTLELGMALAFAKSEDNAALFILVKQGQIVPSDLSGFLVTYYDETEDYSLTDPSGFTAALRSELIQRARSKGAKIGRDDEKTDVR